VNAVLVANTYHELAHPEIVLGHLRHALLPGGKLAIADRNPQAAGAEHAIDPAIVESNLRRAGFEIVSRDDHFLDQPDEGPWWLIVAEAPGPGARVRTGIPIMRHRS
jgi:predicted methyltransferase